MSRIVKTIEKTTRSGYHYEIRITVDVSGRDDARDAGYERFEANLYINGAHIADISPVLFKMASLQEEIDSTDWAELYAEQVEEPADYHGED